MKKYQVLETIIKKNIPILEKYPKPQRKKMLKGFLSENLVEILTKVKLPDPWEIKSAIIKEHFLDQRRRKGYERADWKINYHLWRMLFEAKSELNYKIFQNSTLEIQSITSLTTKSLLNVGFSETSLLKEPKVTYATSTKIGAEVIHFKVEYTLEQKMLKQKNYQEFIGLLDSVCRSYQVSKLGFADVYLYEKKDIENPKWEKIILDVKFYEDEFEVRMEKSEKLRDVIDEALTNLKIKSERKNEITNLEKKFFVNLIF